LMGLAHDRLEEALDPIPMLQPVLEPA